MSLRPQVTTPTSRPNAIGAEKAAPPSCRWVDEPARGRGVDAQAPRARHDDHRVVGHRRHGAELTAEVLRPDAAQAALLGHGERVEPGRLAGIALRRREEELLGLRDPRRASRRASRETPAGAAAPARRRAWRAARGRARRPCPRPRRASRKCAGVEDDRGRAEAEVAVLRHARGVARREQRERGAELDDRFGVIGRLVGAAGDVGIRAGGPDVAVGRDGDASPAPDASAAGRPVGEHHRRPGMVDGARGERDREHAPAVGAAVAIRGDAEVDVPVAERDARPTRARGTDRSRAPRASPRAARRRARREPRSCRSRPRRRSRSAGS